MNQTTSLSASTSASSSSSECPHVSLIRLLNTTIPLIWVCVGTCTNLISLLVFSRSTMRRNSTFFYLTLMTISDLILLWVGSFRDFMAYKFNIYIAGTLMCKLHVFTFFLFAQFSSWMLAAANFDRLVFVVSYNSFSKQWCTKSMAKRCSLVLFAILIAINVHFLVHVHAFIENDDGVTSNRSSATLIHPSVYKLCEAREGFYSHFYTKYYSWIDSFVYSFVPFLIMCVCNITLIKKVFNTKRNLYKKTKPLPPRDRSSTNQATSQNDQELALLDRKASYTTQATKRDSLINNNNNLLIGASTTNLEECLEDDSNKTHRIDQLQQRPSSVSLELRPSTSPKQQKQQQRSNNPSSSQQLQFQQQQQVVVIRPYNNDSSLDRMRNMALTIIGVTVLFIIFTVPINIYIPIMHYKHMNDDPNVKACDDLVFCLLNNMVNANHSTSFFIYLTTNSKFKNEIKSMWKGFWKNKDSQLGLMDKSQTERFTRTTTNTRAMSLSVVTTQDRRRASSMVQNGKAQPDTNQESSGKLQTNE